MPNYHFLRSQKGRGKSKLQNIRVHGRVSDFGRVPLSLRVRFFISLHKLTAPLSLPINLHGWRGPGRGGTDLSENVIAHLSRWLFAIPPLLNPLPALRWRGEETRGAGLLFALEMAITFDLRKGLKPD